MAYDDFDVEQYKKEWAEKREERKNEVLIPESLERLKKVAQFARTQNVLFKKEYDHSDFELVVILHGGYEVTYSIAREAVCERKVIGTREIAERVIPARTEEIVEWECKPVSLLK